MISLLAYPLIAAAVATAAPTRSFWKIEEGPRAQPIQVSVTAELVRQGEHLLVFRERGYRFSTLGENDEERQLDGAVSTFDRLIYPTLVELFGPCPDRDGNGKVILLLARFNRENASFSPFDQMDEAAAQQYGFRSNQGEVLFHSFSQQGDRSHLNVSSLATSLHHLLHHARDPRETAWRRLLATYSRYLCELAPPRLLWGDGLPGPSAHAASDPLNSDGWSLLLVHFLRERYGSELLRVLVARPEQGLSGLEAALAERGEARGAAELLGDFSMACWLDEPNLGAGRFAFSTLAPPRPPAVRVAASRPTSGQLSCGVGGFVHLLVEGDGDRPLPLALRGDASVRWAARAVHLRGRGPDAELPLSFERDGLARLDLPLLPPGDGVVISVVAVPGAGAAADGRMLSLHWGLGWVPRPPTDTSQAAVALLLDKLQPDKGAALRAGLRPTLELLAGLAPPAAGEPRLTTRYAWAPESTAVVAALMREASGRGLRPQLASFLRAAPQGIHQEWRNVLIELPGSDPRRWPVVLAAHWDAAGSSLWDSYQRALGIDENASGVAVALAAAAALQRAPHRAPVLIALLAGGHHDAAGAQALLEALQGRATAWIELDAVGRLASGPRPSAVRVEGGEEKSPLVLALSQALRRAGLSPVLAREISSPHTGASLASMQGIPSLVLRTREAGEGGPELPPEVEIEQVSLDLMTLLARSLFDATVQISGAQQ
ncbi:MAG: M28 family peptidase [Acidobacteriota bacterium]